MTIILERSIGVVQLSVKYKVIGVCCEGTNVRYSPDCISIRSFTFGCGNICCL